MDVADGRAAGARRLSGLHRRPWSWPWPRTWLIVWAAGVVIAALALSQAYPHLGTAGRTVPPSSGLDRLVPQHHRPDPRGLSVGVTHGQYSIDQWGDSRASALARDVLTSTATYQNQHIFGWGALNPEPEPGVFDWTSLDRRVALMRSTGGTPVITLCCAPDWMKGGRPGETNWDNLEVAPTPEHYGDFADLAVAVARRYPDVRHFVVWNEMKGFWNKQENRWNYEAYTQLYNRVYDAMRATVPGIAIGGPYVVIDTWTNAQAGGHPAALRGECGTLDQRGLDAIDYWLRNKRGADFVAVDGSTITRDWGPAAKPAIRAALFGAVTDWLRQRTNLPVWWTEVHIGRAGPAAQPELTATFVAALVHMAQHGVSVALLWQPQGDDAAADAAVPPALWTSTRGAGGGRPLPLADALAKLQRVLDNPRHPSVVQWPTADVGILYGQRAALVTSTSSHTEQVSVQGQRLSLEPFEVRYVPLVPGAAVPAATGRSDGAGRCLNSQESTR